MNNTRGDPSNRENEPPDFPDISHEIQLIIDSLENSDSDNRHPEYEEFNIPSRETDNLTPEQFTVLSEILSMIREIIDASTSIERSQHLASLYRSTRRRYLQYIRTHHVVSTL